MTPDAIVAAARSAIGVPFRHQGRGPNGMDCVGLVIHVCDQFGIEYSDVQGYPRRPYVGLLESAFDEHVERGVLVRVDLALMQTGDFLMMRFSEPQHLAILAEENIIHSHMRVGKVCEHRLDDMWRNRIVRVYRLSGVSE